MIFLKAVLKIDSFSFYTDDDDVFSSCFYSWTVNACLKKKSKEEITSILFPSLLSNGLILKLFLVFFSLCFGLKVFFPKQAVALTTPITNTLVQIPMSNVTSSSRPSQGVVIAGLQPRLTGRGSRGPILFRSLSLHTSPLYQLRKQTSTSTHFGFSFIRVTTPNRVVTMSSLRVQQVQVTRFEFLKNPNFSPEKNIFVEKQFRNIAELISNEKRVSKLTKVLNIEGWQEGKAGSTLLFNADTTHGVHKQNKKMCSIVTKIVKKFFLENAHLFTESNIMDFQFVASESEHVNQESHLESLLLTKNESTTYLLKKGAHKEKTRTVDLRRPETVQTVAEWFILNGERTSECLKNLWDTGGLEKSAESFRYFKKAIKACVDQDIVAFTKTGLPDNSIQYAGQVRAAKIGASDCARLALNIINTRPDLLVDKKCVNVVTRCIEKAQLRAAYIYQGINLYPQDSHAHLTQENQSMLFLESFNHLIEATKKRCPSAHTDKDFIKSLNNFSEILIGQGEYNEVINGEAFAKFQDDLADPKKKNHIVSSYYYY